MSCLKLGALVLALGLNGVDGKVTFVTNGAMTADEFRSAAVSLLTDLGYEVSERDGVLFIGPIKL